MRKSIWSTLVVILILCLLAVPAALAGEQVGSGRQIRGTPGRNAQLLGDAFTLPQRATIASYTCSGEGFWIAGQSGRSYNFYTGQVVVGRNVPAGTYCVYPNLKRGQNEASVTVRFTW